MIRLLNTPRLLRNIIMSSGSQSPELFAIEEMSTTYEGNHIVLNIEENAPETSERRNWCGRSMQEIYGGESVWNYRCQPLTPSRYHTVLFQLPVTLNSPPKPYYSSKAFHWNPDYVRMPFSPKNVFPVKDGDDTVLKSRWDLIQLALLQPILSIEQFEDAIFAYNKHRSKFLALRHLFSDIFDETETEQFFKTVLPKIIQLALQLPELIPASIPLLKQGKCHSVSLSQMQIASLLANAFISSFPWGKSNVTYPGLNFNTLFEKHCLDGDYMEEKIKCILHYFQRIFAKPPVGVVTFERKSMSQSQLPRWDKVKTSISNMKLHITSSGTIEDDGLGLLQIDFANCMVGGGVLNYGCVQEEIRFVICPELLVSRLFTERLLQTEALIITGVERFSKYEGYGDTTQWAGNYEDTTPFDEYGRRKTRIAAIDALYYSFPSTQFSPSKMIRELNKAYVGFHEELPDPKANLTAVATGNWGCGAFQGNLHLKAILQIMACTAAKRDMVYYTFGDSKLRDVVHTFYQFLVNYEITVGKLWSYLCQFNDSKLQSKHLLSYIQQAHSDGINKSAKPKPQTKTQDSPEKMSTDEISTKSNSSNLKEDV